MDAEKLYKIDEIYMLVHLYGPGGRLDSINLYPNNPSNFTDGVITINLTKDGSTSIYLDPSPLKYADLSWLVKAFSFSLEIIKKYEENGLKFLSDYDEFLIREHSYED